jgi:DNA-binding transcriptional ArsR family regulator
VVPGGEDDCLSFLDTVPAVVDIEEDIIEKLYQEQIKEEIWVIVTQVLKDDRKVRIMKMRFIDGFTLEKIAEKFKVSRTAIDQTVKQCFKMIRRNSRTRRLIVDMGLWDEDKPINIRVVKAWVESGRISALDKKELAYAKRMGWIKDELSIVSETWILHRSDSRRSSQANKSVRPEEVTEVLWKRLKYRIGEVKKPKPLFTRVEKAIVTS